MVSAVKHLRRRQQRRALRAWLEYLKLRRGCRAVSPGHRGRGRFAMPDPPGKAESCTNGGSNSYMNSEEEIEEDRTASLTPV